MVENTLVGFIIVQAVASLYCCRWFWKRLLCVSDCSVFDRQTLCSSSSVCNMSAMSEPVWWGNHRRQCGSSMSDSVSSHYDVGYLLLDMSPCAISSQLDSEPEIGQVSQPTQSCTDASSWSPVWTDDKVRCHLGIAADLVCWWHSVRTKRYRIAKCDANWPPLRLKMPYASHPCAIQKKA